MVSVSRVGRLGESVHTQTYYSPEGISITLPNPVNITGKRFNRLVALYPARTSSDHYGWRCVCDCGNEAVTTYSSLRNGSVKSCGCLHRDAQHLITHGMTKTPEYMSWQAMKGRCYQPSSAAFKHYGGRDIIVCERWLDSFENFFSDMGLKPSTAHTLDRINVNGNYEPLNCKWSTRKEQRDNQRKVARIENFTTKELLAELARREHSNGNYTTDYGKCSVGTNLATGA